MNKTSVRSNLNRTSPKNQERKLEPRGCNQDDTVGTQKHDDGYGISWSLNEISIPCYINEHPQIMF